MSKMITISKKQSIIAVMAVVAAVMFAGPIAMNSAFAWGGDDCGCGGWNHHHHHHFWGWNHHHHHHFWGWNNDDCGC